MIYLLLFWEFAKISVVCVGGGYASMPLIQAAVVTKYHWLTLSEFIDIFTISQMTPGPIGINAATFAGIKTAGLLGGIVATFGFVTPSLFICIVLMKIMLKYGNLGAIHGILNGLRPAVVALISAACISFILLAVWDVEDIPENFDIVSNLNPIGLVIFISALIAARFKVSTIKLLICSGIVGLLLGFVF